MIVACNQCETEYRVDAAKIPASGAVARCKNCSAEFKIAPPQDISFTGLEGIPEGNSRTLEEITQEDFVHFIGKNAHKYAFKFQKFTVHGVDDFALTWHWPGFFFGIWWMLYRKLYLWALVAFVASFVPYVNFLSMIIFGTTANYIYYKHAKKKIGQLKARQPGGYHPQLLSSLGGTNGWVVLIPIILFSVGLIAAIAIPQFVGYRAVSKSETIQTDLHGAAMLQEAFHDRHQRYAGSLRELISSIDSRKGTEFSESTEIYVVSADQEHYEMIAFHKSGLGEKFYIHGPGGCVKKIPSDRNHLGNGKMLLS